MSGLFEGFSTSGQEEILGEIEFDYKNLTNDELLAKIKEKGGGSVDIEPRFQGGKAYILGEEVGSAQLKNLGPTVRKILLAELFKIDFAQAGIEEGDKIEFTSIRGNTRQLTYLGKISSEGIAIGKEEDGKIAATVYYLDQLKSLKLLSKGHSQSQ